VTLFAASRTAASSRSGAFRQRPGRRGACRTDRHGGRGGGALPGLRASGCCSCRRTMRRKAGAGARSGPAAGTPRWCADTGIRSCGAVPTIADAAPGIDHRSGQRSQWRAQSGADVCRSVAATKDVHARPDLARGATCSKSACWHLVASQDANLHPLHFAQLADPQTAEAEKSCTCVHCVTGDLPDLCAPRRRTRRCAGAST
jgi:hypothetical protein